MEQFEGFAGSFGFDSIRSVRVLVDIPGNAARYHHPRRMKLAVVQRHAHQTDEHTADYRGRYRNYCITRNRVLKMQRVHSEEDQVLCHDHRIKDEYAITRSALAQIEKIEAVDQTDDAVVDALLPYGWTELRFL